MWINDSLLKLKIFSLSLQLFIPCLSSSAQLTLSIEGRGLITLLLYSRQFWHKSPRCPCLLLLYETLPGTVSSTLSPAPALSSSFLQLLRLGWWQLSGGTDSSPPFGASLAFLIVWLLQSFYSKLCQGSITGHLHLPTFRPAGALCVPWLVLHCHTVIQPCSHHRLCAFNHFSAKERTDMVLIWSLLLGFQLTLLKVINSRTDTIFSLFFSLRLWCCWGNASLSV